MSGAGKGGAGAGGRLEITVSDPVKHNEGALQAYIAFKVSTSTDKPEFKLGQTSVIRRYSDFEWLVKRLQATFPGAIVPPIPSKALVGRFEASFVETRRRALERFLLRVAAHPELGNSADLVAFLQADEAALQQAKDELKRAQMLPPPKKLVSMFKSAFTQTASSVEVPRTPQEALFDDVTTYTAVLESNFAAVHREASTLVRREREGADALFQLGLATTLLGQNEVAGLGEALRCAGHAVDQLSVLAGKGVEQSQVLFEDVIVDWHRAVLAAKAALQKRLEARRSYHDALVEVQRATAAKHRLQGVIGKEHKLAEAEAALGRAQQGAEEAKRAYEVVCTRFLSDFDRFKRDKAAELKQALCAYVQQRVEQHQKVASEYKELLPKLKGVNVEDTSLPAAARAGATGVGSGGSNNNKAEDEAVGL